MADLVRLAYYPFLPEVRQAVRDAGPDLGSLLGSVAYEGVRRRAAERVEGALGQGFPAAVVTDERIALLELLSVPVARMLAVALGDRTLVARYAAAEADRVAHALSREEDTAALEEAMTALGIPYSADDSGLVLHVADYLRFAPSGKDWKLVLRVVERGRVRLPKDDAVRFVQEALTRRITEELTAELAKPLPEEAKEALKPLVERILPKLEEARENWNTGDFGPVQPGLFPPCIKELFEAMKRREMVTHHGRFAFATFLGTAGWNAEQIMDYMATLPNFDRDKSRYQIEHVTGARGVDKYTPPGCATMQTNGVCPLAKRDGLCMKVKHPLSYYRAKIRFAEQDAAAEEAKKGWGKGQETGGATTPTTGPPNAPNPPKEVAP